MNGYWVVLETGQGSSIPDEVHGPYWDRGEAERQALAWQKDAVEIGRRDRFQAGVVDIESEG